MEKKTWNDSSLTRPRKPSSAAENDGLEDGLQSRGRFFVAWKKVMKKRVRQLRIEVKHHHHQLENFYIIRIDPMFFAFLATIHSTFCLKRPKKKMYQKATAKVSANPTHPKWVCSLKRSRRFSTTKQIEIIRNGSEATQKIQSLKFIWSISYVCIMKRI